MRVFLLKQIDSKYSKQALSVLCLMLILAFFVVLGGCHSSRVPGVMNNPAWSYSPSKLPLPDVINQDTVVVEAQADSLDGTILHQLVLARHPGVLAAEARLKEALALNAVAGRFDNPELETRLKYLDGKRTVLEGGLMLSLPWSGRLGAAGHVSDVELAIAEVRLVEARKQAIVELGSVLVRLEGARNRLALNRELSARSAEYAELARTRQSASIADPLDVSLVLADAATDKRALLRSQEEVARRESELRLLANFNNSNIGIKTPLLSSITVCSDADSVISMAQRHSGPLLLARLQYQKAEWEAALASRSRIPDLQLGPTIELEDDNTSVGVAFSMPLPIFNTGTANYKASLSHREAAYVAMEFETRSVSSAVITLLDHLDTLNKSLEDLQGEVSTAAAHAFDLAESRYRAGQTDVLRLLSAHRNYASVQLEIIEIKVARHEAILELESVIGFPLHDEHLPRQLEVQP